MAHRARVKQSFAPDPAASPRIPEDYRPLGSRTGSVRVRRSEGAICVTGYAVTDPAAGRLP